MNWFEKRAFRVHQFLSLPNYLEKTLSLTPLRRSNLTTLLFVKIILRSTKIVRSW